MVSVLRRNNVQVQGEGSKTLVLAHGLGTDQAIWRTLTPELGQVYRLVLLDHVGSGRSEMSAYDPSRYGSLDAYAEDLVGVMQELGLTRVDFLGHSAGAAIGLLASLQRPDLFARLALLTPSPYYLNDPESDYRGGFDRSEVDEVLSMMEQNFVGWATSFSQLAAHDPAAAHILRESICATDPRVARQFAEVALCSDLRPCLGQVFSPCLVLQSNEDALVPVSVGEFMQRTLPQAQLVILDIPGHCPQISHPEKVWEAIRKAWNLTP